MLDEVILYELNKLPSTRTEAINKYSQYFFNTKRCKWGHISRRYSSNGVCVKCCENRRKLIKEEIFEEKLSDYILENYKEFLQLPRTKTDAQEKNSKFYFTGTPCNNNHIGKRYSISGRCVECRRQENITEEFDRESLKGVVEDTLFLFPNSRKIAKQQKYRFYFTGKPCGKGHISKRLTSTGVCITCSQKYVSEWKKQNPEKVIKTRKKTYIRLRQDPMNRINHAISNGIRQSLNGNKEFGKSWRKLVKYSSNELKEHLQQQFRDNMSLENYSEVWEIDHIKPLSLCDSFEEAWSLENLQPLLIEENRQKSNSYIGNPNNRIYVDKDEYTKERKWTDIPNFRTN